MTLVAVLLAALAAATAALCSLADGALLSLDEETPPASPTVAGLLARRETAHRALAFGRIVAQLMAGILSAGALVSSGLPAADLAPLALLAGIAIVIIAESVARTAGDSVGARAVESLAPFIAAITWVMRPVVAFGTWCDALLNHLLPSTPPDEEDREATLEQFREVVEAEADVTRDEAVLLRGVFSLGHTAVQEIMVPRVDIIGIDRATTWSEVVDRVRSARHARLVVFDGTLDEVVGILYAKDLLPAVIADAEPGAGWLSLVRPATFIPAAKNVDARSDIWSLGVVLYEALAGTPPFNAESMPQIVTRILHTPAPPLAESRPDVPPSVVAIVERCLAKDPAARFGDVAELAWGLAPFVEDGARSVERIARVLGRNETLPDVADRRQTEHDPPGAVLAPSMRPGADAWGGTQAHLPRRSAGPWIVAAVLGACVVVGVAAVVVRTVRHREPARSVTSIVAPRPSATAQDPTPVKLAPPSEPPAPSASSSPGAEPSVAGPHTKPTVPRARPAPVAIGAAVTPSPALAPAPAPEPTDPLHMGIK